MAVTPIPPKPEQKEASVYLKAAKQYMDEGSHEQAILMLKAALMLEPDNPQILINLAAAYNALEKYDDALPHLQHAHRLNPTDHYAVAMMGYALARSERWRAAIEQFEILYPLNQYEALKLFRNLFASFNNRLFNRLLVVSDKYDDQIRGNTPAA